MAQLSRRKYAVAVAGLNRIIESPTTAVDKKLRAVELLLSIYDRHDKMVARAEARARKDAGLSEPVDEPETTAEEKAPETVELSAEDLERQMINQAIGWVKRA